jgi:hypothetical protein
MPEGFRFTFFFDTLLKAAFLYQKNQLLSFEQRFVNAGLESNECLLA